MMLFGRTWSQQDLPGLFLVVALPLLLIYRESNVLLANSLTVRIIPMTVGLTFCFLVLALTPNRVEISKRILWLTLGILAVALLSTLRSDYVWQGLARWTEISILALYVYFLSTFLQQNALWRDRILFSLMAVVIVCLAIFLMHWQLTADPITFDWANSPPLFTNIRHFGYIIALVLPLAYWLWQTNKMGSKYIAFAMAIISWGLIFWTGGRGAFLGVIVATLLYFFMQPKAVFWVLPSIVIGLLLSQLFIVDSPSLNLFRLFDISVSADMNDVSSNRLRIYQQALEIWWVRAPLLGIGADNFRYILPAVVSTSFAHPHSVIVQALLSYGLIGASLLTLLFLILARHLLIKTPKIYQFSALGLVSALVHAATDGVFYHAIPLFLVITLLASCLVYHSENSNTLITLPKSILALFIFALALPTALLNYEIKATLNDLNASTQDFILSYPMYVQPSNWIQEEQEHGDPERAEWLARQALTLHSSPCYYTRYIKNLREKDLSFYCSAIP